MKGLKKIAGYLYLIVLSLWVGGLSLFTFMVTPVIFKSFHRDLAADIVARLFPFYFVFTLMAAALSLVLFLLAFPRKGPLMYRFCIGLLVLAVMLSVYGNFRLYPEIVSVKREVYSFERVPPEDPARVRFRSLHARSAVLNLVMIVDGLTVLLSSVRLSRWDSDRDQQPR